MRTISAPSSGPPTIVNAKSALRAANPRPCVDEPAFSTGSGPSYGFGMPSTPRRVKKRPSWSNEPGVVQIFRMTSHHSCASA